MGVEIEKKYRLSSITRDVIRTRLLAAGATEKATDVLEENTIYDGPGLDSKRRVLRLRRVGNRALLTFKERYASESAIKHQREEETEVSDADAIAAILEAIGYRRALVYEKRRTTWSLAGAEVVLDELPFGLFIEIEGEEPDILDAESRLGLEVEEAEHASYPELTSRLGIEKDGVIETRFKS